VISGEPKTNGPPASTVGPSTSKDLWLAVIRTTKRYANDGGGGSHSRSAAADGADDDEPA
jgi:hypothetical protein